MSPKVYDLKATKKVKVIDMVNQAISNLAEMAFIRKVTINLIEESENIYVNAIERDLIRAFSNVLHNAIKYSWYRASELPWVYIKISKEENTAIVAFENYGVAIPQEEIDKGYIYMLGFRGILSGDRGRMGTGIGLTDAKKTIVSMGGKIDIYSNVASPEHEKTDYSKPFITTVIIGIPLVLS